VSDGLSTALPGFTPAWWPLLIDKNINDGALRLYLILASHARPGRTVVFPGQDRLAGLLDVSPDTVQRRLTVLIEHGWIVSKRRGARRTNLYHVTMPSPVPVGDVVDAEDSVVGDAAEMRLHDAAFLRHPNRSRGSVSNPLQSPKGGQGVLLSEERLDDFDAWWKHYPRSESKASAIKAWRKQLKNLPDLPRLITAADALAARTQRAHPAPADWRDFMPYGATWLNNSRWEDLTETEVSVVARPCVMCAKMKPGPGCDATEHGYEEQDCPWK
jgi:hypothetical protein